MAANTFHITEALAGDILPLRGDMAATLNFIPADGYFFTVTVDQPGSYVISSDKTIRGFDGVKAASLTITGNIGIFAKFVYDNRAACWKIVETNMVGAGSSGSGSDGVTPVITAVANTLAPGSAATAVMSGPAATPTLTLGIPRGADGAGGGGGVGFTPEVEVLQSANGDVVIDKATSGNNIRVLIKRPGKFKNPTGYAAGETINLTVRCDNTGPYEMTWELDFAHPERSVPKLATKPGGINWIVLHRTADIDATFLGCWKTEVWPKASAVGYGAPALLARNVQRNKSYYVLRSPTLPASECGMTDMQPGETLKIIRDGLGIEAFGGIEFDGTALITGALPNGNRAELRTGEGVRPAFDRGVIALGGNVVATVQDLILSGSREQGAPAGEGSAQGVSITGNSQTTLRNLRIYDNQNGLLSPNADFTGTLNIFDTVFHANGVGHAGYTHNIYMGRHNQMWYATRTDFTECVAGHNVKSRSPFTLNQCRLRNAHQGREIDFPNGGQMYLNDCIIQHAGSQNDCIRIGAEGMEPNRPREYIIRNCHLENNNSLANAGSFVWNEDPDVDVFVIDCTFAGPDGNNFNWTGANAQGMRGRVIIQFTGGPVGPRAPAGYQSIAVTPVAG